MIRIDLDHRDYTAVDAAMERRGCMRRIPGRVDEVETWFRLPPGGYWREEPTTVQDLLEDARAALRAADELGARVVVTSGETSWTGLEVVTLEGPTNGS